MLLMLIVRSFSCKTWSLSACYNDKIITVVELQLSVDEIHLLSDRCFCYFFYCTIWTMRIVTARFLGMPTFFLIIMSCGLYFTKWSDCRISADESKEQLIFLCTIFLSSLKSQFYSHIFREIGVFNWYTCNIH